MVGTVDGIGVGIKDDGVPVGVTDGMTVGCDVGLSDGETLVGAAVAVGVLEGAVVGLFVVGDIVVGKAVAFVGLSEGIFVGC